MIKCHKKDIYAHFENCEQSLSELSKIFTHSLPYLAYFKTTPPLVANKRKMSENINK
ncbi:hypothetical protein HMPREF3226_02496 [Prevotella corporis]|uniref:Uncharacterized protein n=1 Tax=Prevotella corporis TaxID=28128 RepID=A0A133PVN0_9BACT|nr:hypothetical protein HMPREF3226_02496 [Prevotella corporis]